MKDKNKKLFWGRINKFANIDITNRCPLLCPLCQRQRWYKDKPKPGHDMSLEVFETITDYFPEVSFCGQYSDPVHHPLFDKMLDICQKKNVYAMVHTASSLKPKKWYIDIFKKYPTSNWTFGIDGLPGQSHNYRINQDGEKLFDIMLKSREYLQEKPTWQYIVFKYNEDNVEEAMSMAKENNLKFNIINSIRFNKTEDWLKPNKRIYA